MPDIRDNRLISKPPSSSAIEVERRRQNYLIIIRGGEGLIRSREMMVDTSLDLRGHEVVHDGRTTFKDDTIFRDENPPGAIAIRDISGVPISRGVTTDLAWRDGEAFRNIRVLLDNFNVLGIGTITVEEGDVSVVSPASTIDFSADCFDVSSGGALEADVTLSNRVPKIASPPLTNKSVPFVDSSGELAEDNTNLIYDSVACSLCVQGRDVLRYALMAGC